MLGEVLTKREILNISLPNTKRLKSEPYIVSLNPQP